GDLHLRRSTVVAAAAVSVAARVGGDLGSAAGARADGERGVAGELSRLAGAQQELRVDGTVGGLERGGERAGRARDAGRTGGGRGRVSRVGRAAGVGPDAGCDG